LDTWRGRLAELIQATPNLDWLLLTKRPNKVASLAPWRDTWPANVWLGTTVESQAWAEKRLPSLAAIPARVRFVSCEPLLGELDLRPWLRTTIQWVIAGGESGPRARAPDPDWFRTLRDQCLDARVPFHFKQWGDWAPSMGWTGDGSTDMARVGKKKAGRTLDGCTWDQWPGTLGLA
jgi:protein gp37